MANYRTRSNTQKLQRLIEFLKERDCDSAANLEETAQVFLNDVKPKAHIEGEKFLLSLKECQSEKSCRTMTAYYQTIVESSSNLIKFKSRSGYANQLLLIGCCQSKFSFDYNSRSTTL